jgi:hypothetical protein
VAAHPVAPMTIVKTHASAPVPLISRCMSPPWDLTVIARSLLDDFAAYNPAILNEHLVPAGIGSYTGGIFSVNGDTR